MRKLQIILLTLLLVSCATSRQLFMEKGTDTAPDSNNSNVSEDRNGPALSRPSDSEQKEPRSPAASNSGDVLRLIHAVHLDRLSLVVFQMSYESAFQEGKVSSQQLACVRAADASMFAERFIAPLQAALSHDEIAAALTFFESPAGRKYVALNMIPVYNEIGAPPPVQKPIYSKEDRESISRFSDTAVGAKLLGLNSVFYDRSIKEASASVGLALTNKCAQ